MNAIAQLASEPAFTALRSRWQTVRSRVITDAITIQQIPAPTFGEGQRAVYLADRFKALLDDVTIDPVDNVIGLLPGTDRRRPAVLVSAHTDTVFDASTPLTIRQQADRIYGPGLGDNSLGVAAMLGLIEILRDLHLPADIWFAANSREEGMGNLEGIRAVYTRLKSCIGAAIIIEGMAFGRIYHAGIAVRRFEITCHTPGGHSWLHFGRPSAIHELVQLATQITVLDVPRTPRTTFNIGMIQGGRSVNSIASDASLLLDLRSESPDALAVLESQVRALVDVPRSPDVEFSIRQVGDRQAGSIPVSHPLVQLAAQALELVGGHPTYEAGSTDANVPLAERRPAITVGVTRGGNAHRPDEYIETTSIADGLWQLLLIIAGAASGLTEQAQG